MFYGLCDFSHAQVLATCLGTVRNLIQCNGSIDQRISYEKFSGGIFLHRHLPSTIDDLVYLDSDRRLLVLLSGRVYNESELYRDIPDEKKLKIPELISRMFLTSGPEFVKQLNGDFAIMVYDNKNDQIFLFRDHLGIHPIAWIEDERSIIFSTDTVSLSIAYKESDPLDSEYLAALYKGINFRATPCESVKKIPPGHYIESSGKGIKLVKYWHPELIRTDYNLNHETLLKEIRELLVDSVKIRCDSRFNAGAHVSGGLDSGIVAALARQIYNYQKEFYGFSWSPASFEVDNMEFDEREFVRETCRISDISPVFTDLTLAEFHRLIYDFKENMGFYYEENTLCQASQLNVNLIFSGFGGDEFLSKGDSGINSDLLFRFKWGTFLQKNPILKPKRLLKVILLEVIFPAIGILSYTSKKIYKKHGRYLKKPFNKFDRQFIKHLHFYRSRRDAHVNLLGSGYNPQRTEIWYIMGFRRGIEYRYPLLDKRLVEYMLKVPSELLVKTSYHRSLIREISGDLLPEEVRWKRSGNDPVLFKQNDEYIKESAIKILEEPGEIEAWESNPDLQFIDFQTLRKDVEDFRKSHEAENKEFFWAITFIKGLHEFTKLYKN